MSLTQRLLTLLINLDGSDARLSQATQLLRDAQLEWERLSAVDGRSGSAPGFELYCEAKAIIRHDRGLSGGELGCYLSHMKGLKRFLDTDADHCLLLEDDSGLPADLQQIANDLIRVLPQQGLHDWHLVHLSHTVKGYQKSVVPFWGGMLSHSYYIPCGTSAILWSRAGAKAFLDSPYAQQINGPYDRELRSFCARTGKAYLVSPPPCKPRPFRSDIDSGVNRWAANPKSAGASLRCKIRRHFPDYVNAYRHLWLS